MRIFCIISQLHFTIACYFDIFQKFRKFYILSDPGVTTKLLQTNSQTTRVTYSEPRYLKEYRKIMFDQMCFVFLKHKSKTGLKITNLSGARLEANSPDSVLLEWQNTLWSA